MEHAIRHHIKKTIDEDPVHYQKLSERLEEVLLKFGDNWEQLAAALKAFIEEARKGRTTDDVVAGLDPLIHAPFFDVLKEERTKHTPVGAADVTWLAELTLDLVERLIRDAVSNVGFWKSAPRQEELQSRIFMFLDENEIVEFDHAEALADRLMDLAKANGEKLVRR
jgi:type I restriction enzyme R subunit